MTDCKYCYQECLEGQDLQQSDMHKTCYDEWWSRYWGGLCVRCKKNNRVKIYHSIRDKGSFEDHRCEECAYEGSDYERYPGP